MFKLNNWNEKESFTASKIAQNVTATACGSDINTACGGDINTACGSDVVASACGGDISTACGSDRF